MNLKTSAKPMIRTTVLLDLLRDKLGSDYKTSLAFNKPPNYVSKMRSRGAVLTDQNALIAAEILDFPKESILLSLAAERAINSETMQEISRLADEYASEKMHESVRDLESKKSA